VQRQQGGVVDDGAVLGPVNDLHGDELGAEGQDVELGASGLVLSHHLWDGLALHTPAGELEDGDAILLRLSCCGEKKNNDTLKIVPCSFLFGTIYLHLKTQEAHADQYSSIHPSIILYRVARNCSQSQLMFGGVQPGQATGRTYWTFPTGQKKPTLDLQLRLAVMET